MQIVVEQSYDFESMRNIATSAMKVEQCPIRIDFFGLMDPKGVNKLSIRCLQVNRLIVHVIIIGRALQRVSILRFIAGKDVFAL